MIYQFLFSRASSVLGGYVDIFFFQYFFLSQSFSAIKYVPLYKSELLLLFNVVYCQLHIFLCEIAWSVQWYRSICQPNMQEEGFCIAPHRTWSIMAPRRVEIGATFISTIEHHMYTTLSPAISSHILGH